MNDAKYYDPAKVRLIVGVFDITGFSDGDKLKIEPVTKDYFKSHVGVDGDTSFSKVHDNRYTITFTLKPGSPSNSQLDLLRKTNAPFPVAVTNTSEGGYIGGGTDARIIERPATTFSGEEQPIEWKILIPDYSELRL